MLSHYRRQEWDKAVELCGQLTGEFDGKMDEYYGIWQERIAEMRSRDLPKDWDGIFRAQTK
jgi:hypothetical protein